jgi:mono/diheme cytochrome c family protein
MAHAPRLLALILLTALPRHPARADAASDKLGAVDATTGAAVYQHVCQGCHQEGGRGAAGAGAYPALADNPHLADYGYPVSMVLNGHGGMPWFNGVLSPVQIADVVNFVRGHFGNHYTDIVTPDFVAAAAGPVPTLEK